MTGAPNDPMIPCAVVGAGGYTGRELVRLLSGHPRVEISGVFGSGERWAGQAVADVHPSLRDVCDMPIEVASVESIIACGAQAVFLCTPHEASHDLAPALVEAGLTVLDLSAAFRLGDQSAYDRYYGFTHAYAGWLKQSAYGIAELASEAIAHADLIAVPGCYPTSAILALRPLVDAGLIKAGSTPIIDSVSGVSGAGRTPKLGSLFGEVSLMPYGVFNHRHQPEIDEHAGIATIFTPHLGPFDRGIVSTIHVELAHAADERTVRAEYERAYAGKPLVRLLGPGEWPSVGGVAHTCFCDIGFAIEPLKDHLIVCSAIDNLLKGASGQAVQCFNIRFGMDEGLGLVARANQAVAP